MSRFGLLYAPSQEGGPLSAKYIVRKKFDEYGHQVVLSMLDFEALKKVCVRLDIPLQRERTNKETQDV